MKTAAKIFGILTVLFALLFCTMSIFRAGMDKDKLVTAQAEAKEQLAEFQAQANTMTGETKAYLDEQIAEAEKTINEGPSGTTYLIVQVLLGTLLVLALAFAFLLFRPSQSLVMKLAMAAVVITVAVYFASPDIKRGEYSGLASRTLALLSGIPVIVAGLFALLVAKKSTPAGYTVAN